MEKRSNEAKTEAKKKVSQWRKRNDFLEVNSKTGQVRIIGSNQPIKSMRYYVEDDEIREVRTVEDQLWDKVTQALDSDEWHFIGENNEYAVSEDGSVIYDVQGDKVFEPIVKERWADIPDYEGLYEASDLGNIRNKRTGRILKPALINSGYLIVGLWKDGKGKNFLVHRLVLSAFVVNPNPKVYTDCDHINHIRTDNRLINLRWVSHAENMAHSYDRIAECNRDPKKIAKLAESHSKPIAQIDPKTNDRVAVFKSGLEAHDKTGINQGNINGCLKGKRNTAGNYFWEYITKEEYKAAVNLK